MKILKVCKYFQFFASLLLSVSCVAQTPGYAQTCSNKNDRIRSSVWLTSVTDVACGWTYNNPTSKVASLWELMGVPNVDKHIPVDVSNAIGICIVKKLPLINALSFNTLLQSCVNENAPNQVRDLAYRSFEADVNKIFLERQKISEAKQRTNDTRPTRYIDIDCVHIGIFSQCTASTP